jgi:hypothetical protein
MPDKELVGMSPEEPESRLDARNERLTEQKAVTQVGSGPDRHWIFRPKRAWPLYLVLALGLFGAGVFHGRSSSAAASRQTGQGKVLVADQALALKAGPWGNLEYIPIDIEPPQEFLSIQRIESLDWRWSFKGQSRETLQAFFDTIHLPPQQEAELLDPAHGAVTADGVIVAPSQELILSLSPDQRKAIYTLLGQTPDNPFDKVKVWFRADSFEEQFEHSGLSTQTIDLVKQMSFPRGKLLFFCDAKTVLNTLGTYDEKVRLMKTLLRKRTLLMKLRVTPDTRIEPLVNYWGKAARGMDLRPLLESLANVPGGARLDLVHLLPPIPSANLYTFPFPSTDPGEIPKDCHWASFNFFRNPPVTRYADLQSVTEALQTDYYPVLSDPRYGDIVVLVKAPNQILHTAVFIADNIVYTKNGPSFAEPFLLMRMPDLVDLFSGMIPENEQLQVFYFRNKYY